MQITCDSDSFTLTGRLWTGTYRIEELPDRMAFFLKAQKMFPKSCNEYSEAIAGLEKLAKSLVHEKTRSGEDAGLIVD